MLSLGIRTTGLSTLSENIMNNPYAPIFNDGSAYVSCIPLTEASFNIDLTGADIRGADIGEPVLKYKTVEWLPEYKQDDVVYHKNIIEAKEWQSKGIDVKLFRKEAGQWIQSGVTKLELL